MRAIDVMSKDPNCCVPSSSAHTAAAILAKFELGALPVVDDFSSRKLVGIVTDRDLCLKALGGTREFGDRWVQDCMTLDPVCCGVDTTIHTILGLMAKHRVHRIPVVSRTRRVVGIVSVTDLIRHHAVTPKQLQTTLSGIVRPIPKAGLRALAASAR